MTQTELLHAYLSNCTHGATLRELITDAIATWPNPPRTTAHSVCRLLHNSCAESKGYKGQQNLFAFRITNGRKVWFAI
jgi:glutamate racemase